MRSFPLDIQLRYPEFALGQRWSEPIPGHFQFLRCKFGIFNQFLRDEHIHAQLQKDIRYFQENSESLRKLVSYCNSLTSSSSSSDSSVSFSFRPSVQSSSIGRSRSSPFSMVTRPTWIASGCSSLKFVPFPRFAYPAERCSAHQMGNALGFVRSMSSGAAAVASQMKDYDTIEDDIAVSDADGVII